MERIIRGLLRAAIAATGGSYFHQRLSAVLDVITANLMKLAFGRLPALNR